VKRGDFSEDENIRKEFKGRGYFMWDELSTEEFHVRGGGGFFY